jgi:hypothetical protein
MYGLGIGLKPVRYALKWLVHPTITEIIFFAKIEIQS